MKKLFGLIFLFIVLACNKKQDIQAEFKKSDLIQSRIDSLRTVSEVEQFIHNNDSTYKYFLLKSPTDFVPNNGMEKIEIAIADSLKVNKSYYKEDLDNNGFTDLIVTARVTWDENTFYSFTFLNYGNDSIKIVRTEPYRHTFTIPKITYREKQPLVEMHYVDIVDWKSEKFKKFKRLVTVKFGNYIEFNNNPANYKIEKIELTTTPCYGTCPVFGMVINKDKSVIFKPKFYNFGESEKEENQILNTTLDDKTYNELLEILNYIDFPKLKNNYDISWTDQQTSTLKVTYDNGKVKTIEDYGLTGSYGLRVLYEKIFQLRKNQNWKNTTVNSRLTQ